MMSLQVIPAQRSTNLRHLAARQLSKARQQGLALAPKLKQHKPSQFARKLVLDTVTFTSSLVVASRPTNMPPPAEMKGNAHSKRN